MGYIMPVDHFQYVQYGNRVAFKEENKQAFQPIEGAKPIFPVLLQARTEEKQEEDPGEQSYATKRQSAAYAPPRTSMVSAPSITGKGMLLDQLV